MLKLDSQVCAWFDTLEFDEAMTTKSLVRTDGADCGMKLNRSSANWSETNRQWSHSCQDDRVVGIQPDPIKNAPCSSAAAMRGVSLRHTSLVFPLSIYRFFDPT